MYLESLVESIIYNLVYVPASRVVKLIPCSKPIVVTIMDGRVNRYWGNGVSCVKVPPLKEIVLGIC